MNTMAILRWLTKRRCDAGMDDKLLVAVGTLQVLVFGKVFRKLEFGSANWASDLHVGFLVKVLGKLQTGHGS